MAKVAATNDLTVRLDASSKDETGAAAKAFNGLVERFRKLRSANLAEDVKGTVCEECIAYSD